MRIRANRLTAAAVTIAAALAGGATSDARAADDIPSQQRTATAAQSQAPASTAPQILPGLNQPGLAWTAGLPYPPDQFGAIGPDHYVQGVTNTGVAVFSRHDLSKSAGPVPAGTFAAAPDGAEVVDTQMMWDRQTSRWYYAFSYKRWRNNTRIAGLLYGWSRTADPTDLANGWCRLRIDNGADFDDRPKLGDNRTHLVIATNADPIDSGPYDRVWTMPKPRDGDTSCPASQAGVRVFGSVAHPLRTSDGDLADNAIAAQDNDGAANAWVMAADADGATGDQIMLWHVNRDGELVADGNIDVSHYREPAAPPQPDPYQPLDPVDDRLNSAIADTDPDAGATAVWASHTIADPSGTGRSIVRWYEIVPSACDPVTAGLCSPAARRQQGQVKDPASWLFNAAMAPTDAGNEAVLHYNAASPFELVQVRARSRGPSAPPGTLGDELLVASSDAAYDEPTCHDTRPYCRWGDYSAATTDPVDAHAVWGSSQVAGPENGGSPNWRTRNFALRPGAWPDAPEPPGPAPQPPGPTPSPCGTVRAGKHRAGRVTVVSRNLSLGLDLIPLATTPPGENFGEATAKLFESVRASEPDDRMELVAREIVRAQPDLVGLQEVALWRTGPKGDPAPATHVAVDYLGTLRKKLKCLGASYRVVADQRTFDIEVPGGGDADVRLTDGNVVLARRGVRVTGARSHNFRSRFSISGSDVGTVRVNRGFNRVDAKVGGRRVRFVNTHLEAYSTRLRLRQARELRRGPLASRRLPAVLAGDLNSGPALPRADRPPYAALRKAGFREARRPRFTCCFSGDLRNGAWDRAVDHVMLRGRLALARSWVTGRSPRTAGGLAASDHGGVVSVLRRRR